MRRSRNIFVTGSDRLAEGLRGMMCAQVRRIPEGLRIAPLEH